MGLVYDSGKPARHTKAEQDRWAQYAAAALTSIVRTDSSPGHAADRAAAIADAMLEAHKRRWAK